MIMYEFCKSIDVNFGAVWKNRSFEGIIFSWHCITKHEKFIASSFWDRISFLWIHIDEFYCKNMNFLLPWIHWFGQFHWMIYCSNIRNIKWWGKNGIIVVYFHILIKNITNLWLSSAFFNVYDTAPSHFQFNVNIALCIWDINWW